MCVSGCPYKKVYFNHKTGKAEKCTFCYPRIEVGIPTVCSETCVGRLRYIGLVLYDADRVLGAASVENDHDLRGPALGLPRPQRPGGTTGGRAGRHTGRLDRGREAVAGLCPHQPLPGGAAAAPGTALPMVWYIPPLSPVVDVIKDTGHDAEDPGNLFAAIDTLRIPVEYLANLFTAGDTKPVDAVLKKLAAMRSYMRDINLGRDPDDSIPESVGMDGETLYDMFRLLAIAKYDERYVIPTAHAEQAHALEELATECSLDYEGGPGMMGESGPFGEGSGELTPWRSRTSRCSSSARPPTSWPAAAARRARQPAQLGRQGLTAGPVPQAQQGDDD